MRLLAHPDPVALEQELLERIAATRVPDRIGPVLVLVPTLRLAEHLERRLAATRKAWLGLEVLHFRALALRILEAAAVPVPRLLSSRLLEAALQGACRHECAANGWSRFLRGRPGALAQLAGAMRDLREAGIEPAAVEGAARDLPRGPDLAQLYAAYVSRLSALAGRGCVDDAALMLAASAHAPRHARRYKAVFLHGVYELIGVHLDMLRQLDRGCDVTVLLAARAGAPVSSYAESFARKHFASEGTPIESIEHGGARGDWLAALYDEPSRPLLPPDRLRFRHAQGAAAEVEAALREALAAVRDGCPPEEILLTARTLEPYAAALEAAFEDEDLPWVSSLQTPLRRQPLIHDLLLMLDTIARDFPRRDTAELLRSPRVRWAKLLGEATPVAGDRAELWSRKAGIIGGLDEWSRGLREWVASAHDREADTDEERAEIGRRLARDLDHADRIGRALGVLRQRVDPDRPRSWSDHAVELEAVLEWFGDDREAAEIEVVRGLLREMRDLAVVAGPAAVPFAEAIGWLEQAIDRSGLDLRREDRGGIRVLEAMQARGLTFRRVFLLGMNTGVFPRPVREDPVLGDELRRRLVECTGRPLPLVADGRHEERLLLSLLLGAASERVDVSWQRADESGRAKTRSQAVRELARLALGEPRPERLEPQYVPSHPLHRLASLARHTGLLAPAEERVLVALHARGAEGFLDGWFPDLAPGLSMLRETESFVMGGGKYDGRIGRPRQAGGHHSASALETLGRCPLQYFFKKVLRVSELEAQASPFEIDKRDLGRQVHTLLHDVYAMLLREGGFESERPADVVAAAAGVVAEAWDRAGGEVGRSRERRVPLLWSRTREEWIGALRTFLEGDLDRMLAEGLHPAAFEERIEREIDLGDDRRLRLLAVFDRRLAGPDGPVVSDYKTSGNLREKCDPTVMLKGQALQVPLYRLLAGEGARVEVLGVGPGFDPAEVPAGERRVEFDGFEHEEQVSGFAETLRVLLGLVEDGSFGLRPERHCDWCDYRLACRNKHPPTLEREEQAHDTADYRLVLGKNKTQKRLLAKMRPASADRP